MAHLLKYDSIYGRFDKKVSHDKNHLIVEGKKYPVYAEKDPANLPWKDLGVDIVLECTGLFTTKELSQKHIYSGAKTVIISAPPKGQGIPTFILGVNEQEFDKNKDFIISNGSCTTNCLVPLVKIIHDEFKIKGSFFNTIHSYTNNQRLFDVPHKDLRRARAAAINIIPTTTGASKSVIEIIPELKGRISGAAVRVPTSTVSLINLICDVEKPASADKVNSVFKQLSSSKLANIIQTTDKPLVSTDFIGNTHSAIVDCLLTETEDNLIKVVAWYDNEYGYACRLVDMAEYVGKKSLEH